jgi:hypothetical protein
MASASVRPWLFVAASLMPASAALAQGAPVSPAHQVLLQDVGTWDAEIVRWGASGVPRTSRGVEINTLGCDGTCLVTKVQGGLAVQPVAATEPTAIGRRASRGSGWHDLYGAPEYFVTPFQLSPFNEERVQALLGPVPPARTTVEYPSDGKRVVTMYGRDRKGNEVRMARITYIRRS